MTTPVPSTLAAVKLFNVNTTNSTGTDEDGGRATRLEFKGRTAHATTPTLQTLAMFTAAHEGAAADTKGRLQVAITQADGSSVPALSLTAANITVGADQLTVPELAVDGLAFQHDASHALVFGSQDALALTAASTGCHSLDAPGLRLGAPVQLVDTSKAVSVVGGAGVGSCLGSGLVLQLPFARGSYHDTVDSTRQVAVTGTPMWAPGPRAGLSALAIQNATEGTGVATQYAAYTGNFQLPMTLAFWVLTDWNTTTTLVSVGGTGGTQGALTIEASAGSLVVKAAVPTLWTTVGSAALATGTWHHVCVTVSAAYQVAAYLDGAALGRVTGTDLFPACTTLYVGAAANFTRGARARFTDVRVYNRALPDVEVAALSADARSLAWAGLYGHLPFDQAATVTAPATGSSASAGTATATLADGLVLYAPFEDGTYADVVTPTRAVAAGVIEPAVILGGRTGTRCLSLANPYTGGATTPVASAVTVDFAGPFTSAAQSVAFWFRTDTTTDATLGGFGDAGLDGGLSIDISAGTLTCNVAMPSMWTAVPAGTVVAGQWHHLAVTFDATYTCTVYLDGVLRSAYTGTAALQRRSLFRLGGNFQGATAWRTARAQYDDVRVYSRALTAAEVACLASDEATNGGALTDAVCGTRRVALTGPAARYVAGPHGLTKALWIRNPLTGEATAAQQLLDYDLALPAGSPVTVALWVNPATVSLGAVASLGAVGIAGTGFDIDVRSNSFSFAAALPNAGTVAQTAVSGVTAAPHTWYHLAVTLTDAYVVNLYINGVSRVTGTGTGMFPAPRTLRLGASLQGLRPLQARYADVRVYSRALSAAEVSVLSQQTPQVFVLPANLGSGDAGFVKTVAFRDPRNLADSATVVVRDGAQNAATQVTTLSASRPVARWLWTGAAWLAM